MWLKSPRFWRNHGVASVMLQPIACAYASISNLRYHTTKTASVSRPVICIGNITAGGAGKTPVAIAIQKILREKGTQAAFLSRGYGGSIPGPHLVTRDNNAMEVGDEPLLLSQYAPAWISRNRIAGAEAAIGNGAEVIIMDDGFQNPSIHKDISVLVIDGSYGIGNGRILPAGPLRETLANALKRTQAVVILGDDQHGIANGLPSSIPVFYASIKPREGQVLEDKPYLAFAGIGNPDKFFATLGAIGKKPIATKSFPDHYPYTENNIGSLLEQAKARDAVAITTEKDWVRIPKHLRGDIAYLPVEVKWNDEAKLTEWLDQCFGKVK